MSRTHEHDQSRVERPDRRAERDPEERFAGADIRHDTSREHHHRRVQQMRALDAENEDWRHGRHRRL